MWLLLCLQSIFCCCLQLLHQLLESVNTDVAARIHEVSEFIIVAMAHIMQCHAVHKFEHLQTRCNALLAPPNATDFRLTF